MCKKIEKQVLFCNFLCTKGILHPNFKRVIKFRNDFEPVPEDLIGV